MLTITPAGSDGSGARSYSIRAESAAQLVSLVVKSAFISAPDPMELSEICVYQRPKGIDDADKRRFRYRIGQLSSGAIEATSDSTPNRDRSFPPQWAAEPAHPLLRAS